MKIDSEGIGYIVTGIVLIVIVLSVTTCTMQRERLEYDRVNAAQSMGLEK